MNAFGDRTAQDVTTREVSVFLRELDHEGLTPRNVNKHREALSSIFTYACRDDTLSLPKNPVEGTDQRREPPPAVLDYYEVEEVEALARACEQGKQRSQMTLLDPEEIAARAAEDRQDAEACRLLFYTGLRLGEVLALRWSDVDLADRLLLVRRAVSHGQETLPKGRRHRFVPLSTPAAQARSRLGTRGEFTAADDYVLCNLYGRRIDGSALRRRYKRAAEAAGLRPVKLHGLRHAAGSLVARTSDPVFVRDFLGHAVLNSDARGSKNADAGMGLAVGLSFGHARVMRDADLEFWTRQSSISDPGEVADLLLALPADADALTEISSQLVFHYRADGDWEANGIESSRADEINLCYAANMFERLLELDPSLGAVRPPGKRILGCCRDFSTLYVSMLRQHRIAPPSPRRVCELLRSGLVDRPRDRRGLGLRPLADDRPRATPRVQRLRRRPT